MNWNHRVMNCPSENGGEDFITFKEVYYEDDVPTAYSDPFIGCDTKQELEELVARLGRALEQQMLHEDIFKQGEAKTYQIEMKRTSYVNLEIEAESEEEAEALALLKMERDYYRDDGSWEIESIELDDIATDETRSYGPQGETA